jgi:hypothetical protein
MMAQTANSPMLHNTVETLQSKLNLVLYETGEIFLNLDKRPPQSNTHASKLLNVKLNEVQNSIHATLDKTEMELVAAKTALERELQTLREKRLKLEGKTANSAEKAVTTDGEGDFTMVDHADAVAPAASEAASKAVTATTTTASPATSTTVSAPAVKMTAVPPPTTRELSASFLTDLTTSPASNLPDGSNNNAINNGEDPFNLDLSLFPGGSIGGGESKDGQGHDMSGSGLDFGDGILDFDFGAPVTAMGDGNTGSSGNPAGTGANAMVNIGSQDSDLMNAIGSFDMLPDTSASTAPAAANATADASQNGAGDNMFDDLMRSFGDDLGGGDDDAMNIDLNKDFEGLGDDDLFGDFS